MSTVVPGPGYYRSFSMFRVFSPNFRFAFPYVVQTSVLRIWHPNSTLNGGFHQYFPLVQIRDGVSSSDTPIRCIPSSVSRSSASIPSPSFGVVCHHLSSPRTHLHADPVQICARHYSVSTQRLYFPALAVTRPRVLAPFTRFCPPS